MAEERVLSVAPSIVDPVGRAKVRPTRAGVGLECVYSPSDDGVDENLLIVLHGLGDTMAPFVRMAKQLKLPQTATLVVQAPDLIPFLDEGEEMYQWYTSFTSLGELIERPNPLLAVKRVHTTIEYLESECQWPRSRIHLFGFAQGGSVALESALRLPGGLKSVVSVGGELVESPTRAGPGSETRVLYVGPSTDEGLRKGFTSVRIEKVDSVRMLRGQDEWSTVMRFWSEVLERRGPEGEGIHQVLIRVSLDSFLFLLILPIWFLHRLARGRGPRPRCKRRPRLRHRPDLDTTIVGRWGLLRNDHGEIVSHYRHTHASWPSFGDKRPRDKSRSLCRTRAGQAPSSRGERFGSGLHSRSDPPHRRHRLLHRRPPSAARRHPFPLPPLLPISLPLLPSPSLPPSTPPEDRARAPHSTCTALPVPRPPNRTSRLGGNSSRTHRAPFSSETRTSSSSTHPTPSLAFPSERVYAMPVCRSLPQIPRASCMSGAIFPSSLPSVVCFSKKMQPKSRACFASTDLTSACVIFKASSSLPPENLSFPPSNTMLFVLPWVRHLIQTLPDAYVTLATKSKGEAEVIQTYRKLIREMPRANQYLLLYVLDLLSVFARKSDKNLMTESNLAVIFRPGIISLPAHEMKPSEHALSQEVLVFLIEHQDHFMLDPPARGDSIMLSSGMSPGIERSAYLAQPGQFSPGVERPGYIVPSDSDEDPPPGGYTLVERRRDPTAGTIARRRSLNDPSTTVGPLTTEPESIGSESPVESGGKVKRSRTVPSQRGGSVLESGGAQRRARRLDTVGSVGSTIESGIASSIGSGVGGSAIIDRDSAATPTSTRAVVNAVRPPNTTSS
ncbi:phospholipase/carboxylesterase [Rhizoctonia solani AG-3 Rhs1AP]|uniref:Phospholipase/carboxylesterase n=1 Tax=Rhizoctonia solani AG-3 Rhs1AP TaxID=1086054 RepID=X8JP38_9AGAM|nr:phospholipase/carboxylesterase [Rhizoctonia solani AG-3 Rhs1AP]